MERWTYHAQLVLEFSAKRTMGCKNCQCITPQITRVLSACSKLYTSVARTSAAPFRALLCCCCRPGCSLLQGGSTRKVKRCATALALIAQVAEGGNSTATPAYELAVRDKPLPWQFACAQEDRASC